MNETIVKIIVVLSCLGISFSIMSGEIESSCKLTAYAGVGYFQMTSAEEKIHRTHLNNI